MPDLTRRGFIQQLGCAGASLALSPALGRQPREDSHPARRPPNVVIVLSDDQGYGDFGCFGNPILQTPNLDQLYGQSARLTNFIVSPLCAPTRASLMTGRYNYRTGVWDAWMGRCAMNGDEVTIAEQLAVQGYRTGIFGKWHLGENCPQRAMDNGFQDARVIASIDKVDPLMDHNGVLTRVKGFVDDIVFDDAIDFIEKNAAGPFFAYVASVLPHDSAPPQAPPEYVAPYRDAPGLTEGDQEVYGMVAKLDQNVGRLLKKLDELGLEEDTVVFFLSDNGPLRACPELVTEPEQRACQNRRIGDRYNRGLRGSKANVYEGGIKTPCFVRWPGVIEPDRDLPQLAAHIDIFPTVTEMCRAPLPAGVTIDGMSLWPLLSGATGAWPDRTIYIQSDRAEVPRLYHTSCARQQRYKLIDDDELYDLQEDPGEAVNIAAQHPEIVRQMRREYEAWFRDVSSERDFQPSYAVLGSTAQRDVRFSIWNRHSTGFPVKIVDPGPYRVTVDGIQADLFDATSRMCIRIGNQVHRRPIDPEQDTVVFENLVAEKGFSNFDIWPEGFKQPSKMYYGNEDFGYRYVTLSLVEH